MGDSQEEKSKGGYYSWSPGEHKTLLGLLVEASNQNLRDASGSFNKHTVEQRILPALNKSCGSMINYNHYKNRMRILRGRYKSFVDLLRHSSGFGWDPVTKKFTAPEDVWEDYLKNIATGKHAVSLGDSTDARTYGDNDSDWIHERFFDEPIEEDDDEFAEQPSQQAFARNSNVKLPVRKKAKIDKEKMVEEIMAVAGMSSEMFNMMQRRWEKEAEEKMV